MSLFDSFGSSDGFTSSDSDVTSFVSSISASVVSDSSSCFFLFRLWKNPFFFSFSGSSASVSDASSAVFCSDVSVTDAFSAVSCSVTVVSSDVFCSVSSATVSGASASVSFFSSVADSTSVSAFSASAAASAFSCCFCFFNSFFSFRCSSRSCFLSIFCTFFSEPAGVYESSYMIVISASFGCIRKSSAASSSCSSARSASISGSSSTASVSAYISKYVSTFTFPASISNIIWLLSEFLNDA